MTKISCIAGCAGAVGGDPSSSGAAFALAALGVLGELAADGDSGVLSSCGGTKCTAKRILAATARGPRLAGSNCQLLLAASAASVNGASPRMASALLTVPSLAMVSSSTTSCSPRAPVG